jgi:FkbM family methyltransferase
MAEMRFRIPTHGGRREMLLDLDTANSNERLVHEFVSNGHFYEPDLSNVMIRALRDGDTVIDVGANIGYFTMLAATCVGATGKVIAFEPDPANVARLEANAARNGFTQVEVVARPASDAPGPVTFHFNADDSGGNALWDPGQYPTNEKSRAAPRSVTVEATTLAAAMAERALPTPRLIKVDTEGADHSVLKGAVPLLEGMAVPYVLAELHEFGMRQMGTSQAAFRAFMEGFGYATFMLFFDGSMPRLVPPGVTIETPVLCNMLFTTPERLAELWPVCRHNPGILTAAT